MDSVTHLVLGAAIGEVMLGKKLGNKAMLLGALANTIPDFDVAYSLFNNDEIKNFVFHRSYTHSILAIILVPFLVAWLSEQWSDKPITYKQWYWFWFAGMITHVSIDCCTTYGTKIFTPFSNYQVAFNNLSIIDPVYTIPFLLLVLAGLFASRNKPLKRKLVWAGIGISSAYLFATFFIKLNVHNKFKESLHQQNIAYDELNTTPTILNGILWSANAYTDSMLYIAEYSYMKKETPITWSGFKRNLRSIKNFDCDAMKSMVWFADGNYFVERQGNDTLVFYNAKWGKMRYDNVINAQDAFIFYALFYKENGEIKHKQVEKDWKFNEALKVLMDRIGI